MPDVWIVQYEGACIENVFGLKEDAIKRAKELAQEFSNGREVIESICKGEWADVISYKWKCCYVTITQFPVQ